VDREKITGYLLCLTHQFGGSKARFFMRFGFTMERWQRLAEELRRHGRINPVTRTTETIFGPRFEVEGPIRTPDGRDPHIRTVWQLDEGETDPRLITAHPLEKS